MAESRTQKSIRNAKVALFFSVLTFALGFFSRKILLDALGADILGLYTTANNLCGFLNMAEMGITSAVAFSLYKPIFDNDRQAITEIVSIQGWLFRYVGVAMIVGAVILMACFPVFFSEEKTHLPLWYSYATFGVVFLSQVLGYFFCYQQTLLSADQQEYMVVTALQGGRSLKMVLQIVGIGFWGLGYEYWLIAELGCGMLTLLGIRWAIRKQYPWLNAEISHGRLLNKRHPVILQKTKQLAYHWIFSWEFQQTAPLIIYGLLSLSTVAIFGNYLMLFTNVGILTTACFSGMYATTGNLIAEGNNVKIMIYFKGYKAFRYWFVSIICFCLYHLTTPFIVLWIGEKYILDDITLYLFVVYAFINNTRTTEAFTNAYGLYQDIWAPIAELLIYLIVSIVATIYLGVRGVLVGVIVSQLIIISIWKPYFLYTRAFMFNPAAYVSVVTKPILLIAISWLVSNYTLSIFDTSISNIQDFINVGIITFSTYAISSTLCFCCGIKEYKTLVKQLVHSTMHWHY